jgi:hypothetical protein
MAKSDRQTDLKALQPFPARTFQRSVQEFPDPQHVGSLNAANSLTIQLASFTDTVPIWGINNAHIMQRDRHLRDFWRSESTLAGAIYSISSRNAAFEWVIEAGNERLETALTDMLHMSISNNVHGWLPYALTYSQELYTQDNGVFTEIIRDPTIGAGSRFKGANAPVIGIGVLESYRCFRTGNPEFPVIYTDDKGIDHKMPWWSIIPAAEMPSAMETMRGAGFCSISRVLRIAQILREIAVYKNEKVSGRFVRQIHFVGGVSRTEINDVTGRQDERLDNENVTRYATPVILASLDPEKPVSTASIDFAQLPDNFNLDEEMRWYISTLALGMGVDYQDFAPLPSGNMGSGAQSEILHRKSRGKGPALFMEHLQNAFRYYGVLPQNARFRFVEKDMAHEREKQELRTKQAEELAIQLRSGQITPAVARDLLVRRGALTPEDISKIDEDYGLDLLIGGNNNQMLGDVGGNTIGEDAKRVEKQIVPVIDEFTARKEGLSVWLQSRLLELKQQEGLTEMADSIRDLAVAVAERDNTEEMGIFVEAIKEIGQAVSKKQPIVVNTPEQKQPIVNVEAPIVNVPEPKVIIEKDDHKIEEIEIVERDKKGRTKTLRKTRK